MREAKFKPPWESGGSAPWTKPVLSREEEFSQGAKMRLRDTRELQNPRLTDQRKLHSQSPARMKARTLENLTPRMKAVRDAFIAEYLKDWNGVNARIRSGGSISTAQKMAYQFLHEPYVQQKVMEYIEAASEASLISNKTIIMGLIREAMYNGIGASHGARVSSWGLLAKIKGLEKPTEINAKVKFIGGVMIVPATAGVDDWEKLAEVKQAQLKDDVRT